MMVDGINLVDVFWNTRKNAPKYIKLNQPKDRNSWRLIYKLNRNPITGELLTKPYYRSNSISGVGINVAFESIFAKLLKDFGLSETEVILPLKLVIKRHFKYAYLQGNTSG